ncbi:HTH-type transcriptional repressor KstR2 [compost metagenome]
MNGVQSPWKPQGERKSQRAAKREAVLRAAARAFNARGFHNTSLDDVAADLNVSKPTVYYYGVSKEALLADCYRAALETLDEVTQRTGEPDANGRARLWVLIVAYAEAILSEYGRCLTRVPDTALSPPLRQEARRMKRTVDERIRGILAAGVEDGSLRLTNTKLTAFAIAGALNSAALWFEEDGSLTPRDIGQHYADLFTGALSG